MKRDRKRWPAKELEHKSPYYKASGTAVHMTHVLEREWGTDDALPDPPALQAWVEITAMGNPKRRFILVPHCPIAKD